MRLRASCSSKPPDWCGRAAARLAISASMIDGTGASSARTNAYATRPTRIASSHSSSTRCTEIVRLSSRSRTSTSEPDSTIAPPREKVPGVGKMVTS